MEINYLLLCRQSILMLTYIVAGLTCVSSATADQSALQTCTSVTSAQSYEDEFGSYLTADAEAGCVINWVQNNRLFQVTWHRNGDVFEEEVVLNYTANDDAVLSSSRPPRLLDVDDDGWLDLTTFETLGRNGGYHVFLYDPSAARFNDGGSMFGRTFIRDNSEYFVSASNGGADITGFEFSKVQNGRILPVFYLEVSALEPSENHGRTQCKISIDGSSYIDVFDATDPSDFLTKHPEMIQHYCNTYEGSGEARRGTELVGNGNELNVVPEGTIFYCRLEGSTKAVTIGYGPRSIFYSFGPVGGEAELELVVPHNLAPLRSQIAADGPYSGDITFPNGAYEYIVYKSNERAVEGDASASQDAFNGGLVVYRDGVGTAPIFERSCIPRHSYDGLFPSANHQ